MAKEFNKTNVLKYMGSVIDDHLDSANEVNYTSLAEDAAAHFEVNDEGGPLDDQDHWIWEIAITAADKYGPKRVQH